MLTTGVWLAGRIQNFYAAKLSADFKQLLYSTYLGSRRSAALPRGGEEARACCADANGNLYVTGEVLGPGWPVVNAFQPNCAAKGDGAIVRFAPALPAATGHQTVTLLVPTPCMGTKHRRPLSPPFRGGPFSAGRAMQMVSWTTVVPLIFLAASFTAAAAASAAEAQILERSDLPGGLIRESLRLPGFDPDEAVPAVAIHPASGGPFPVAIVLHGFRGAKENLEAWCRDLAARGVFAVALDAHLHGERSVAGVFHGDRIASLGGEYAIWVHQTSIARTAMDVPVLLDALAPRPDVDGSRVAATGVSMGASTAMVLAWREPRVRVVASIVGAVDSWWDVTKLRPGPERDARIASYGPRLRELVASIDPRPRLGRIPPKAVFLANGGRDEYIDIESVRRFVADLEPLYGEDRGHLRFLPFPEAGHGVSDAMWKEAQDWIVRGLHEAPPGANPR
jgi:hypothetical protein